MCVSRVCMHSDGTLFFLQYKGLQDAFPENVHLLTLEYLETNKMLLRLENQFEAEEPTVHALNSNATINLNVSVDCSRILAI